MWSYLLSGAGITGLLIAATRPRVGWYINIAAQTLWMTYAVTSHQYGFAAASVVYGTAYVRLLRRARRSATTDQPTPRIDPARYGARP